MSGLTIWFILSATLTAYGFCVAAFRGQHYWSAWGYPEFSPDALGMLFFVVGLVSLVLWATSALTLWVASA